jgi:GR25 family glycosyltransferase involved in LPS biosynthesis
LHEKPRFDAAFLHLSADEKAILGRDSVVECAVSKLDGYFINLDRSADRRLALSKQLAAVGMEDIIKRFPAIDGATEGPFDGKGDNGVWACRMSHEKIILQSDPESATIILEDDVDLSECLPHVVNEEKVTGIIESYPGLDMFFLDCLPTSDQIPALLHTVERNMRNRVGDGEAHERHQVTAVDFPDAKPIYEHCAAAYVVLPKGKQTLRRLLGSVADAHYPIDNLYRMWIRSGELNAHITVPFLASSAFLNDSTIDYPSLDESQRADDKALRFFSAARRLMFGGDPNFDQTKIEALFRETPVSPEFGLGMRIYRSLRGL